MESEDDFADLLLLLFVEEGEDAEAVRFEEAEDEAAGAEDDDDEAEGTTTTVGICDPHLELNQRLSLSIAPRVLFSSDDDEDFESDLPFFLLLLAFLLPFSLDLLFFSSLAEEDDEDDAEEAAAAAEAGAPKISR